MEIANPVEIPCKLSNNIADLAKSPDFGKGQRPKEREMAANSKKPRPSAFRDFPVGCGRNAPAMTREDLAVKQASSENHIGPVKGDADARNSGEGEGLKAGKLEGKQALTMLENGEKLEESGDVMPVQSVAEQPASETKIQKKKDGEGDQLPSKSEAKQSTAKDLKTDGDEGVKLANPEARQLTPKAKSERKENDEEGVVSSKAEAKQSAAKVKFDRKIDDVVPSKSEAKQSVPKGKIDRKVDGKEGAMPAKPEVKQLTPKVKIARRLDDDDGGEPSKPETKHSAMKAKIDRKGDNERGVMASKPEAKQPTPKKMRPDKGNGEEDNLPAKSEAKQAASKIKIDKKRDGEGDESVTPSNRVTKKVVQKKNNVKEGEGEGEGGSRPSESKQVKKKIMKKNDAAERVAPSTSKYKKTAPKVERSDQDTATKMQALDSEEPVPMDSETTPVKKENYLEDQEEPETGLTPVDITEPGSKKRKKAPPNKNKRSGKKTTVFRSNDGDNDGSAVSDRKKVKDVLMTYDALRRNFMVEDEAIKAGAGSGGGVKRPDLKAGTMMLEKGLWLNRDRRIVGSVPGVQSGDHFFFRMELCILGLHGQVQAGIDYIGANNGEWNDPVAISIIASGGYEDDEDDGGETLVYTGQGGNSKLDKKQNDDQKLERGNLALERSKHHGVEVRVIRGIKDNASPSGKIYVYDGLYKVEESWLDKGKSGYGVFKYRLERLPGQPELASDILKSAVKWKSNPSLRHGLINPDISSKRDNLPVYLVNDVDDDEGPKNFEYISKVSYSNSVSKLLEPSEGCDCKGNCGFSDKCSCFQLNGRDMAYTQNGILVKWRPLIYECGEHCRCPQNCRNRVSQKGPKFHLEVFRKDNGRWGVRSWDPIPGGSFICEYVGEVLLDEEIDQQFEENQYVLSANRSQENSTDWGNISDILPEKKQDGSSAAPLELKFTINAKEMGNVARFINQSCSPNAFLQCVLSDHQDSRFPHIMLFSIEHIPPLTELTVDYGVTDMQTT